MGVKRGPGKHCVDAARRSSVKHHIWVFIDPLKVGRKYSEVFIGFGQSYKGDRFHQHVHTCELARWTLLLIYFRQLLPFAVHSVKIMYGLLAFCIDCNIRPDEDGHRVKQCPLWVRVVCHWKPLQHQNLSSGNLPNIHVFCKQHLDFYDGTKYVLLENIYHLDHKVDMGRSACKGLLITRFQLILTSNQLSKHRLICTRCWISWLFSNILFQGYFQITKLICNHLRFPSCLKLVVL